MSSEDNKIFKVTAMGDVVYIKAATTFGARKRINELFGEIPESIWEMVEVDEIPEGEEAI